MSMRRTTAAVGIAVAVGALGGAAVYAATDSGGTGPGRFAGGPPPNRAAPREHADPATVRSESVLADGNGGFTTVLTQTGVITALSPTEMTVRSADGFTQSYMLAAHGDPAAIPPFHVDDTVLVHATRNGPTLAVTGIGVPPYPPPLP
ncbi:hypothetical protein [Mycolicibacterium goodii]|uniref:DUF5666 domain-containing protein n=1 Tax=Mycolicibacterium goodii TaxID=134601 RepID=A0ABS6HTZ8_MYCGD|nr:hypothetical protein [Mycolicibacterium goodii]OKH61484.1 hypothetical protein EB74_20080 [Mycobacterium sp. SWH-M5]MBU8819460.1 hypothetical protein [Mycolicibacterium goodii]MBU8826101.1 hypothetical protein [Mycolicibacterium goodii]MBU8831991.1 hypothetical protein [Mycolicibacterium goodii]MBU8839375.1 hypothetical protein [Mycolicibacterium goodii]